VMARCAKGRKPHPKCRPARNSVGTVPLRLRDDGRWVRDNGDPGLAFVGLAADATDADSATIWVANCACTVYAKCPVAKALAYAADRFMSASVVRRRATTLKLNRVRKSKKARR